MMSKSLRKSGIKCIGRIKMAVGILGSDEPNDNQLLVEILRVLKDIRSEIAGSAQDGTPYYTRDD